MDNWDEVAASVSATKSALDAGQSTKTLVLFLWSTCVFFVFRRSGSCGVIMSASVWTPVLLIVAMFSI
jgi:hypothetical protein